MQERMILAERDLGTTHRSAQVGLPPWVEPLVGPAVIDSGLPRRGLELRVVRGEQLSLVSLCARDALFLEGEPFRALCIEVYRQLRETLSSLEADHPIRVWNFIPDLLAPLDPYPQRYMAFNSGRFAVYSEWFDSSDNFPARVPTASGTGTGGPDLWVYGLAHHRAGKPIENPRQTASYRYSQRWGPLPPCFARATSIDLEDRRLLLIGGTASVLGEESLHLDDLESQTEETLRNLSALIAAGEHGSDVGDRSDVDEIDPERLGRLVSLRAYHPRSADGERIREHLLAAIPGLDDLELVHSELCRPELLIEMEGLAEL